MPVPDSGMYAALGYARESGIPFGLGLVRNHYVGRTFIEPKQAIRHFGVKVKLNPVREVVEGKRVVLVDDSIIRGTTSRKIVRMLREAGAREVHVRISSPPTTASCHYGIDTPTRRELIASTQSVEEIRQFIEADSLGYLSAEGMLAGLRPAAAVHLHGLLHRHLPGRGRPKRSARRKAPSRSVEPARPPASRSAREAMTGFLLAATLAFRGATLIDGTGARARPNSLLVISDGRIVSVGTATPEALAALPAGNRDRARLGQVDRPGARSTRTSTRSRTRI